MLLLLGGLSWWLARPLHGFARRAAVLACILLVALLYSPIGTAALTAWLQQQTPRIAAPGSFQIGSAVAVLLGRGPQVAAATTAAATALLRSGAVVAVYVSGDAISTAQSLERQGVPTDQISGDSFARTTWENPTLTSTWLLRHYPSPSVLLITDPWQLPRVTAGFRRQGLVIESIPAEP